MKITCPACESSFAVPAKALMPSGRKVKCSKCAHIWHADAPKEDTPKDAPGEGAALQKDIPSEVPKKMKKGANLPSIQEPKRIGMGLVAGAVVALLLAVFTGMVADRHPMVSGLLGMESTDGLVLTQFSAQRERDFNKYNFLLDGMLINESDVTMHVPNMQVSVLSSGGRVMGQFEFEPPEDMLGPGGSASMRPEISNVAGNADTIVIEFGNGWEMFWR